MQFIMQVLDADYFLKDGKPVVRIFGKKPDGTAVCVMDESMAPYFYCDYNENVIEKCRELGLAAEAVDRRPAIGYSKETKKFLKITTKNPQDVPMIRAQLGNYAKCYEADVLFSYRYMIDKGIGGMGWACVTGEAVKTTTIKHGVETCTAKSVKPIDNVDNAPLRYMCIDIECLQLDQRRAPESARDPIIIIALEFYPNHNGKQNIVLLAKNATGMPDYAKTFNDEKAMLEQLKQIIEDFDPDIITGYNINGFDLPYIEERMKKHKIRTDIGRSEKPVNIRSFAGNTEAKISGRVIVDTFQVIKRDVYIRFVRYDLNTVAKNILGESKHEMKYTEIPKLWSGDVKRLIEYAKQDASLAMKLMIKAGIMDKFMEISKISGILLQDSFRGQSVRIETMLMAEYAKRGMLIPLKPVAAEMKHASEQKIIGGAVLEPDKGLHVDSVLVLDFQSLYPSIIKTYNLSPDSLITGTPPENVKHHQSPNSVFFVDSDYYKGVFPAVIDALLAARREAKKQMKTAKEHEKTRLDARQYALKIMANAFYGYCGYMKAKLFVAEMANAITAYGRNNIEKARKIVEEDWKIKVIYGDTDSLFLKAESADIEKLQEYGKKISEDVSKKTGLVLEFEKIYKTFLILTKKRYAGWKFEKTGNEWKNSIEMRGIETVRRDWCGLVPDTMNAVLETILKERDVKKSVQIVREVISGLINNTIPIEKLIIVKGITKAPGAYEGLQPHIEAAKKMAARNPSTAPGIGDRIGFVIIRGQGLVSKRTEDPEYVKEKGLQIDADYYINNQLLPPLERIMQAAGVEKSELMGTGKQTSIFDTISADSRAKNVCTVCGQAYRRAPIKGVCDCGGSIREM